MPNGKASIDWDGYELLVAFHPFRPDIVDEIKAAVPQHSRRFDAEDKVWRVSTIYRDEVVKVLEVFEYAVRDYSGNDPKDTEAKIRQAKYRAKREAYLERIKQKEAERKAEEIKRAFAEEKKQRRATRNANGDPIYTHTQTEGSRPYNLDDLMDSMRYAHESKFQEPTQEQKAAARREKWKKEFYRNNPSMRPLDFDIWYEFFLAHGRDEANRMFREKLEQRQRAREQYRQQQRQKEDFWNSYFGGKNSSGNARNVVDHYSVLGIVSTCTREEFMGAYRKLAMQYHPDRNPGNKEAETKMKQVNAAMTAIKEERGW